MSEQTEHEGLPPEIERLHAELMRRVDDLSFVRTRHKELGPANVTRFNSLWAEFDSFLREQLTAAVLAERERCALICESFTSLEPHTPDSSIEESGARECARLIRKG